MDEEELQRLGLTPFFLSWMRSCSGWKVADFVENYLLFFFSHGKIFLG